MSASHSVPQSAPQKRHIQRPLYLAKETLMGLLFMHRYRFLTIAQFARVSGFSLPHSREVLRDLHARGALGYTGYFPLPGTGGRAPKVYFLKRKGFLYLTEEGGLDPQLLGEFHEAGMEPAWSPQMTHRLCLLDLMISLETAVQSQPHLQLIETFLEYRRARGTKQRETADYVCEPDRPENRIVPDGAFVLENFKTGRRGLFFLEMDMGTERIAVTRGSRDLRATVYGKLVQYDTYLTSGRFAKTYEALGDFRFATVLIVTTAKERIDNIRVAAVGLSDPLHRYYRLTEYQEALRDFLGPVWNSRSPADPAKHALTAQS